MATVVANRMDGIFFIDNSIQSLMVM
jgi:hypothetical protein